MAKQLTAGLDDLEDVALRFQRPLDIEGLHLCCKLIWNTSMPLLQQSTRKYARKSLYTAGRALETSKSPLHRLRAQIHFETARCEAADDALLRVSWLHVPFICAGD